MPQPSYTVFSEIYDMVMRDVDYVRWAQYVVRLAGKYHFATDRVLNVACGSGNLELQLAPKGCHITGLDASPSMLQKARAKLREHGLTVDLHQGDMRKFDLGQTFPLALCLYDSINYLLSEDDVAKCFAAVAAHVVPGGGFIFDVTTEYNIMANFSNFTFAENFERFAYIWENTYNLSSKICTSDVTVFLPDNSGDRFTRATERHRQKIYPQKTIQGLLRETGFQLEAVYDGMTVEPPGRQTERIHFVCRRSQP